MNANNNDSENLACMQVWSGNQRAHCEVKLQGIRAWIFSSPYGESNAGGDIHYVTSCASGRVTRILLADVSGHGEQVSNHALDLKRTMHKYINHINQFQLVKDINIQFTKNIKGGKFATALALTYFSPTGELTFCNAGHPSPIIYKQSSKTWQFLEYNIEGNNAYTNLPFGISEETNYQSDTVLLEPEDLILLYTDSLIEATQNGNKIGLDGLLEHVKKLNPSEPDEIVKNLTALAKSDPSKNGENLANYADDCTILLFSIAAKGKIKLRQKLLAPWFLLKGLALMFCSKEKLPLPRIEWSLRNFGGYFFHWFNKK